jgi:hypothetical protein
MFSNKSLKMFSLLTIYVSRPLRVLVTVVGVGPVRMAVIFFIVPVFVYMRFTNRPVMFMVMMKVVVHVPVRVDFFGMQVNVLVLFGGYEPDAGDREENGRQHHPAYPFMQKYKRDYGTDKRGEAKEGAGPEGPETFKGFYEKHETYAVTKGSQQQGVKNICIPCDVHSERVRQGDGRHTRYEPFYTGYLQRISCRYVSGHIVVYAPAYHGKGNQERAKEVKLSPGGVPG